MILPSFLCPARLRLLRFSGLFLGSLLGLVPAPQAAESASIPANRYTLDRASLRAFEEALAAAASQVPAIQRQAALRRLRERLNPPVEVELASSDAGWALRLGESLFPPQLPGAAPQSWSSKDGQKAQVSLRWRGDVLEQSIVADDRSRLNAFSFDPVEKVLRLEVRLHGSQLRQPIGFTLCYLPDY
jgi:hypothetical protein